MENINTVAQEAQVVEKTNIFKKAFTKVGNFVKKHKKAAIATAVGVTVGVIGIAAKTRNGDAGEDQGNTTEGLAEALENATETTEE